MAFRQALQFLQIRMGPGGTAENQVHVSIEAADCVDEEMRTLDPFQSSGKYHHRLLSPTSTLARTAMRSSTWKRDETIDIDTCGNDRHSSWFQSGP